jgi:hypothetical protein
MTTVSKFWKECDRERLEFTNKCRIEASKWEREGDEYGWNFHQGVASGTVQASFIYAKVERRFAPAVDAMAAMLKVLRTEGNERTVNDILKAAGYEP